MSIEARLVQEQHSSGVLCGERGGEGGRKEDGEAGEVDSVGVGDILVTGEFGLCPSPYVFAPLRHCVK